MQAQLAHFTQIGPSLARSREVDNSELDALMVQLCG
jgi:hypothetical protein